MIFGRFICAESYEYLLPGTKVFQHLIDWSEGVERFHVVCLLKRRWLGAMLLAHAADHLTDRRVLMLFHPQNNLIENLADPVNTILQKLGSHHRNLCPGH